MIRGTKIDFGDRKVYRYVDQPAVLLNGGSDVKRPNRVQSALLALAALIFFLLITVRGPIFEDGVLYYAPIILGAFVAWRWKVFCFDQRRPRSYTFLAGVVGGIVGTLVWPTGILIVLWVTGNASQIHMPVVLLFASLFIASSVGGVVAMILSSGFERETMSIEGTPSGRESVRDNVPVQATG